MRQQPEDIKQMDVVMQNEDENKSEESASQKGIAIKTCSNSASFTLESDTSQSKIKSKRQKHRSSSSDSSSSHSRDAKKPKKLDENSIEYWNELRAKQGLRPLKETKKDEDKGNNKVLYF